MHVRTAACCMFRETAHSILCVRVGGKPSPGKSAFRAGSRVGVCCPKEGLTDTEHLRIVPPALLLLLPVSGWPFFPTAAGKRRQHDSEATVEAVSQGLSCVSEACPGQRTEREAQGRTAVSCASFFSLLSPPSGELLRTAWRREAISEANCSRTGAILRLVFSALCQSSARHGRGAVPGEAASSTCRLSGQRVLFSLLSHTGLPVVRLQVLAVRRGPAALPHMPFASAFP